MNQQNENRAAVDWDSLITTAQRAARLTSVDCEPNLTREGEVEKSEVVVERVKNSGVFLKTERIEHVKTSKFIKGAVQVLGPHWPLAQKARPSLHYPSDRFEQIEDVFHESFYYALLPDGQIVEVYLTEEELIPKPGCDPLLKYRVVYEHECRPLDQFTLERDKSLLVDLEQSLLRLLSDTAGSRQVPIAPKENRPRSQPVKPTHANALVPLLRSAAAFLLTFAAFTLATYLTSFLTYVKIVPQVTDDTTYYWAMQHAATSAVGASIITGFAFAAIVGLVGSFFCTLPLVSVLYAVLASLPISFELPYLMPAAGAALQEPLYLLLIQVHLGIAVLFSMLAIPGPLALAVFASSAIPYRQVKNIRA